MPRGLKSSISPVGAGKPVPCKGGLTDMTKGKGAGSRDVRNAPATPRNPSWWVR
jgi:hypothetical protein